MLNLTLSKKEILEMKSDDDDYLLESMTQISRSSQKMNDNLKNIYTG